MYLFRRAVRLRCIYIVFGARLWRRFLLPRHHRLRSLAFGHRSRLVGGLLCILLALSGLLCSVVLDGFSVRYGSPVRPIARFVSCLLTLNHIACHLGNLMGIAALAIDVG